MEYAICRNGEGIWERYTEEEVQNFSRKMRARRDVPEEPREINFIPFGKKVPEKVLIHMSDEHIDVMDLYRIVFGVYNGTCFCLTVYRPQNTLHPWIEKIEKVVQLLSPGANWMLSSSFSSFSFGKQDKERDLRPCFTKHKNFPNQLMKEQAEYFLRTAGGNLAIKHAVNPSKHTVQYTHDLFETFTQDFCHRFQGIKSVFMEERKKFMEMFPESYDQFIEEYNREMILFGDIYDKQLEPLYLFRPSPSLLSSKEERDLSLGCPYGAIPCNPCAECLREGGEGPSSSSSKRSRED
jgi:hypothetical protein